MDGQRDVEVVGVVPAAGRARRVSPLPGSKELFPIGFHLAGDDPDRSLRPKPVCYYLLEQLRAARVDRAVVVLNQGKWDVPAYLGDGSQLGIPLAYLVAKDSPDTATTVDRARPFIQDSVVAFGFPDIVTEPEDLFLRLLDRQTRNAADVVLGLFPAEQPRKMDMVEVDDSGQVRGIVVKPERTDLRLAWISATWTLAFTSFLHRFQDHRASGDGDQSVPEIHIGEVIGASIDAGLRVDSVVFSDGSYIDIGTPEDLVRAVRLFSERDGTS